MDSWLTRLSRFFKRRSQSASKATERPDRDLIHHDNENQVSKFNASDFTPAGLNLEAARRQARIGRSYTKNAKTAERLEELQNSIVTLPPHRPWKGDYTDWEADPFKDLNWRFQFHTLRWINPLLWDALDGNLESKNEWKRIVKSWADANIPPERAKDKYAWMDMTDGNRAIQTSIGAALIDDDDQWYVDLLVEHRNWLLDDDKIVGGNHGLHQNVGLFVVAAVLDDKIGMDRAVERLGQQVLEVFEEEGLNEEGSVAYHQTNISWWKDTQKRLSFEGYSLPPEAAERLEKAGETMAYLLLPDGTMPQIGDGGRGKGRGSLHPLIAKVVKGDTQGENLATFKHYKYGFTIFRSGWGETRPADQESHTIIRQGADLKRHSHNDRGALHLYSRGQRWLSDGGFHSYQQRNRDRNYTKSRRAHNVIHIPEIAYDKTGNVPVELLEETKDIYSIEILDENFETASWRRRVIYIRELDIWIVWDRVTTKESVEILQQWLVDVGIVVRSEDPSEVILEKDGQAMRMNWLADMPKLDIEKGDRSSGSKRGLIGVGWKKMRNGTSIHAKFSGDTVESIVVIGGVQDHPNIETVLLHRDPMTSFQIELKTQDFVRTVDVQPDNTKIVA